jgi:uncharacterized ferritin-like protein (DUF455 family)
MKNIPNARRTALELLLERDPDAKVHGALNFRVQELDRDELLTPTGKIPGRPDEPKLVQHTELKRRSMKTVEGRAALIHALAHIELNAVDLALDIVQRFAGLPPEFYWQCLMVAR